MIRPYGLVLALALLLAIAATVFGVRAVSSEHHGVSGAGHAEHPTHVADHEGEEEKEMLDAGEGLAAVFLSVLAIALVPIGIRTGRSAEPPEVHRFAVASAVVEALCGAYLENKKGPVIRAFLGGWSVPGSNR